MVAPAAGSVVLIPFPFSELSSAKLRPALVIEDAGRDDFVLCQITSNPYADPRALRIDDTDFATGGLLKLSFVRPGKLFTASASLMSREVGRLRPASLERSVDSVVRLIRSDNPRPAT